MAIADIFNCAFNADQPPVLRIRPPPIKSGLFPFDMPFCTKALYLRRAVPAFLSNIFKTRHHRLKASARLLRSEQILFEAINGNG